MQIHVTVGQLGKLSKTPGNREMPERMGAHIFEQGPGKISHINHRPVIEAPMRLHGGFRCPPRRTRHMLDPRGARNIDSTMDRVDP